MTTEQQPIGEISEVTEVTEVTETAGAAEAPPGLPPVSPVKKDRRALRAALRWTAAVVVFAAVGAGTAYGITGMERTDVPGLATESDGRWVYPEIVRPPLPSGSPGPFAEENTAGSHYADLRELLLPAPKGATADKALQGEDGWLATKDFLAEYRDPDDRVEIGVRFTDAGLRHIAARGWKTDDGTHTRVYLLQFDTAEVAEQAWGRFAGSDNTWFDLRGTDTSQLDPDLPIKSVVKNVQRAVYVEDKPYGAEQVRHAYLSAGDVLAVVVQSRKGTAATIPFQQTVVLQSQLLG